MAAKVESGPEALLRRLGARLSPCIRTNLLPYWPKSAPRARGRPEDPRRHREAPLGPGPRVTRFAILLAFAVAIGRAALRPARLHHRLELGGVEFAVTIAVRSLERRGIRTEAPAVEFVK